MIEYKPIACDYHSIIEHFTTIGEFCRIQYYTDIREFITVNAMIKDLYTKEGEEFMVLSTGETVRLDRLVRINDKPAPGYTDEYFKCDC